MGHAAAAPGRSSLGFCRGEDRSRPAGGDVPRRPRELPGGCAAERSGVLTGARGPWRQRLRRAWAAQPTGEWLGWAGILLVVATLQGPALLGYLRNALDPQLVNDDARQQIFPFFRYVDSRLFAGDYLGDYYLACLPAGYRWLFTATAVLGLDPTTMSKWLPLLAYGVTAAALTAAARRLGGKLAALGTLAILLGSSLYLERMSGGLPRTFAFPLLALALERLSAGRVRALALLAVLGAAFYPVVAVILGLGLAGWLLLLPAESRGEATDWLPRRRWLWVAATAASCVLLLLPSTLAARRFGPVVTPGDVAEIPEAGPLGRYGPDDRAPFAGYLAVAAPLLRPALVGTGTPWVPQVRAILAPRVPRAGRAAERMQDGMSWVLRGLLLAVAIGWTRLSLRDAGARRVLLLAPVAVVAHAVACRVAPFLYLPQRYVLYVVPLMAALLVPTAVVGLAPRGDRPGQRRSRLALQGLFTASLLVVLGGEVGPRAGLGVDLRPNAELFRVVESLPPTALVAGWPRGQVNDIPYAARRPVLLSFELHQAFHRGYVAELRSRMEAFTAAYWATSRAPLDELRRRWGVTHLLVDRRHLTGTTPSYFAPFDDLVGRAVAGARGQRPELLRQLSAAAVYRRGDLYLLDLERLLPQP